ncbi:MAG: hypothetical protein JJU36_05705 [Phycisphaeraceae bacterium]|nr:hypothetical protein [Phycisphaeraceae bacterium]
MSQELIRELQAVLQSELEFHEQLAGLVERQILAARQAQATLLRDLCIQERALTRSIASAAEKRMTLVAKLSERYQPETSEPLSLKALCAVLPSPLGEQVLPLRERLYDRMSRLAQRVRLLRATGDSLLMHMQGVVRTLATRMSRTGVYPAGRHTDRQALSVSTFSATA